MILAELPIAWWAFWLVAAALVFPALVWLLTRLAVRVDDEEEGGTADPTEAGVAPHGTSGRGGRSRKSAPRLLVAVALAGLVLFGVALGASLGAIGSDERAPDTTESMPGMTESMPGMTESMP